MATAVCVCVSVCLSLSAFTLLHGPGCNLVNGRPRWCPLVAHYWADLQSVHGFRCYNNTHVGNRIALYTTSAYSAERKMSASARTASMARFYSGGCCVTFYIFFLICLRTDDTSRKIRIMRCHGNTSDFLILCNRLLHIDAGCMHADKSNATRLQADYATCSPNTICCSSTMRLRQVLLCADCFLFLTSMIRYCSESGLSVPACPTELRSHMC